MHEKRNIIVGNWNPKRLSLLCVYVLAILIPEKIHQIKIDVWGWMLRRFDPLPPEKEGVPMREYFDSMPVDKAVRHLEYLADRHSQINVENAVESITHYSKKDQKVLKKLLDLNIAIEKQYKNLLALQKMRKENKRGN